MAPNAYVPQIEQFLYGLRAEVSLTSTRIRRRSAPKTTLAVLLVTIACAWPALAQSDETAKSFHVLPHLVDGGGWQSSLLVTNVSPSTSPCTVQLHGLTVDRFEDADGVTAAGSTATFALAASGGNLAWHTGNQSAAASGYATLDCDNPVVVRVVLAWIGSAGTPTGMATVFSSQMATVFRFPVLTPEANLGLTIANNTDAQTSCRIVLEDPQQVTLDEAAVSVPAKSHTVQFLNQAIQVAEDFTEGSATVSCDQQVAMIGLDFELRSDGSIITFNALPPAVLDPSLQPTDETAKNFHVLPHIADGGGWQSFLLVTNVSPSASPCTLQLYGGLGVDRFEASAGVTAAGLTATFALPASGGHLVWRTRNELAAASGYATLDCVYPVAAQVVFAWTGSAGTPTGMATVFSSQAGDVFQLPVLNSAGTLGLAIANDASSEASCRIVLEDPQGMLLGESALSVPAQSNVAQVLNSAVAIPEGFRGGTAWVVCDQPVSVIGRHLELEAGGGIITFTTLPPAILETSSWIDSAPTATISATPVSIDWGKSATLSWSSASAAIVEISSDVGAVGPSGSREVSPRTTTTYQIMVTHADGRRATASTTVTVTVSDRAALTALYEATDGANWNDNTNWLTDAGLEEWYGIQVDGTGRVVEINLMDTNLRGFIPPEIGSLDRLITLNLNGNNLPAPIPAEVGMLANLRVLELQFNQLGGSIPPELGKLQNLTRLQLRRNRLTGAIPPELGNLRNLTDLDLGWNSLVGTIPSEIGALSNLQVLSVYRNGLSGGIPAKIGGLSRLRYLWVAENGGMTGALPLSLSRLGLTDFRYYETRLCDPDSTAFGDWLTSVANVEESGLECARVSRSLLEALYRSAGGAMWTRNDNWLTDAPLSQWHGVQVDDEGQVVSLDLGSNNLSGSIPSELSRLSLLKSLNLMNNPTLEGRIPLSLAYLPLEDFDYSDTNICVQRDASFRRWLQGVTRHAGTGLECEVTDRDVLELLYWATAGPNWDRNEGWLTEAPLEQWQGVRVNDDGRVESLQLSDNNLTGAIPPQLGGLMALRTLQLAANNLTGAVPAEVGSLAALRHLSLYLNNLTGTLPPELGNLNNLLTLNLDWNNLSGAIPPQLGSLLTLQYLQLAGNNLTGAIPAGLGNVAALRHLSLYLNNLTGTLPPELGNLTNLVYLDLSENELNGPIAPELGRLASLQRLDLSNNELTGAIPAELGDLANLVEFHVQDNDLEGGIPSSLGRIRGLERLAAFNNANLSGALPDALTGLRQLASLHLDSTGVCAPRTREFQEWLDGLTTARLLRCGGVDMPFYLTQAVQSLEFPVPLVAGNDALLRVFVVAEGAANHGIPRVRATFYQDGGTQSVHVADIPAQTHAIPSELSEGNLSASANALIPGHVIVPGLEVVVEVDPDSILDPALSITRRIPASGRASLDVQAMPAMDLTVVPLRKMGGSEISRSLEAKVAELSTEHETFELMRKLLPVGQFNLSFREPLLVSNEPIARYSGNFLPIVEAARVADGAAGNYVGIVTGGGIATFGGKSAVSNLSAETMAHELGHNLSLPHAPCGAAGGPDPFYPHRGGSIGAWGYDFDTNELVPPSKRDIMGYCFSHAWISDYNFHKSMKYRLNESSQTESVAADTAEKSLLLWGGTDADGVPQLHPSFLVDAPPALPQRGGPFRLYGQDENGGILFSIDFAMQEIASNEGGSSFVYAVPAPPEWEGELASVTLTDPNGTATLGRHGDIAAALIRDPVTGRVRGILHEPQATAASESLLVPAVGLDVQTSRGIPVGAAWK